MLGAPTLTSLLVSVLFLAALAPPCRAQRIELELRGGYFIPAVRLMRIGTQVFLPNPPGGITTVWTDSHHEASPAVGANLTAWLGRSLGLDLGASLRFSNRTDSSTSGSSTTIGVYSLRVVTQRKLATFGVRLGAGLALVHFGGPAYAGGGNVGDLAKQSFSGGTLSADLTRTIGGLRLRLGLEDATYRVALWHPINLVNYQTSRQHDLLISLGVAMALR